jgi:hypothetical protein
VSVPSSPEDEIGLKTADVAWILTLLAKPSLRMRVKLDRVKERV